MPTYCYSFVCERRDVYEWLMFKTEDSEDREDEISLHHDNGIGYEDILNGNITDDCFDDISRNFITPSRVSPEYDKNDNKEDNHILVGELNVIKVIDE